MAFVAYGIERKAKMRKQAASKPASQQAIQSLWL